MSNAPLERYWTACVDKLKDRTTSRTLWEALEAAQAITVDGDILVLGLSTDDLNHAGVITQTTTQHALTTSIHEVFGRPLEVSVIEGATPADWEAHKEREKQIAVIKQQSHSKRPTTSASSVAPGSWEALYEQMARMFSQFPYRALPQGKARFANEALYVLLDSLEALYPNPPDDHCERSLARVLERIGNSSEIPASVLAFELERLRAWKASEAG